MVAIKDALCHNFELVLWGLIMKPDHTCPDASSPIANKVAAPMANNMPIQPMSRCNTDW